VELLHADKINSAAIDMAAQMVPREVNLAFAPVVVISTTVPSVGWSVKVGA
jgi:hypothetical protein